MVLLLFQGCFFGTFQTAQPIMQGEIDFGLYMNIPAYLSEHSKNQSIYEGYAILPYGGIFGGIGATRNLSIGLSGSFLGVGPYAKWTVYKFPKYESYISIVPHLYVDVLSTSMLTPQIDFIWGAKTNKVVSWYMAYQVMYSGTGYKYNELVQGILPKDTIRIPGAIRSIPGLHHYIAFGVDLSGNFKGQRSQIPYGLRMELGGSYFYSSEDNKYYPFINLGIALTGGTALGCITVASKEPDCCIYGAVLGYSMLLKSYTTPTEEKEKKPQKETGKKTKNK